MKKSDLYNLINLIDYIAIVLCVITIYLGIILMSPNPIELLVIIFEVSILIIIVIFIVTLVLDGYLHK